MSTNRLPVFRDRFNELKGDRNQQEFADFLGISRPTVALYASGERIPDAVILKQIAERCGVSADYLLGLSDAATADKNLQFVCDYTGLAVDEIMALKDVEDPGACAFFSSYWRDFMQDYLELLQVIGGAQTFLDRLPNMNTGDACYQLSYWKKELSLAKFNFSERCMWIADMEGASETLDMLKLGVLEIGEHIETSNN